jgi:hypothetical protein
MKRGTSTGIAVIVAAVVAFNVVVLFTGLGPLFITYAKLPPVAVACSVCATPEVQRALAEAEALVRSQMAGRVAEMWPWWFCLLLVNAAAPIVAWKVAREKAAV